MSIILSEKGKTVLMVNGYKYGFQKYLANEIKRWTCNVYIYIYIYVRCFKHNSYMYEGLRKKN
jgi:hypothetical protein